MDDQLWSEGDVKTLLQYFQLGYTSKEIGLLIGKSSSAVDAKYLAMWRAGEVTDPGMPPPASLSGLSSPGKASASVNVANGYPPNALRASDMQSSPSVTRIENGGLGARPSSAPPSVSAAAVVNGALLASPDDGSSTVLLRHQGVPKLTVKMHANHRGPNGVPTQQTTSSDGTTTTTTRLALRQVLEPQPGIPRSVSASATPTGGSQPGTPSITTAQVSFNLNVNLNVSLSTAPSPPPPQPQPPVQPPSTTGPTPTSAPSPRPQAQPTAVVAPPVVAEARSPGSDARDPGPDFDGLDDRNMGFPLHDMDIDDPPQFDFRDDARQPPVPPPPTPANDQLMDVDIHPPHHVFVDLRTNLEHINPIVSAEVDGTVVHHPVQVHPESQAQEPTPTQQESSARPATGQHVLQSPASPPIQSATRRKDALGSSSSSNDSSNRHAEHARPSPQPPPLQQIQQQLRARRPVTPRRTQLILSYSMPSKTQPSSSRSAQASSSSSNKPNQRVRISVAAHSRPSNMGRRIKPRGIIERFRQQLHTYSLLPLAPEVAEAAIQQISSMPPSWPPHVNTLAPQLQPQGRSRHYGIVDPVWNPDGVTGPFNLLSQSEDGQGVPLRSLLPIYLPRYTEHREAIAARHRDLTVPATADEMQEEPVPHGKRFEVLVSCSHRKRLRPVLYAASTPELVQKIFETFADMVTAQVARTLRVDYWTWAGVCKTLTDAVELDSLPPRIRVQIVSQTAPLGPPRSE